jgi:hypothetical protein
MATTGSNRLPTTGLLAIARMVEARQVAGVSYLSEESVSIAGGCMCFSGVGSWTNQAMGWGMNGPVRNDDLDRLIEFYESRRVEPKMEVCPYADNSLIRGLEKRRFLLREVETILTFDLLNTSIPSLPNGVQVVEVDPCDPSLVEPAVAIKLSAFAPENPLPYELTDRRVLAAPGCKCMLARIDGEFIAAANCDLSPPCAALFSAGTLPHARNRGAQTALLIARLHAAKRAGCSHAFVASHPIVATGRNALRIGFTVAYTKVIVARPGPGLAFSP